MAISSSEVGALHKDPELSYLLMLNHILRGVYVSERANANNIVGATELRIISACVETDK